jgi:hypothetical protein
MTIKEAAEEYFNGEIDIDVCDSEIDMTVAFCYTVGDNSDCREKFLELLSKNVRVVRYEQNESIMTCDFSGFYRKYRDSLSEWFDKYTFFRVSDKDEVEHAIVLLTKSLIAGVPSESTYESLLKVFA